jgi:hypothetical protein
MAADGARQNATTGRERCSCGPVSEFPTVAPVATSSRDSLMRAP